MPDDDLEALAASQGLNPNTLHLIASRQQIAEALPEVIGHLIDTAGDPTARYQLDQSAAIPTAAYYGAGLAIIHEMVKALAEVNRCRPLDVIVRLAHHMPEAIR